MPIVSIRSCLAQVVTLPQSLLENLQSSKLCQVMLLPSLAKEDVRLKQGQEPLLLVATPGAPSSFLFLVVRPGATLVASLPWKGSITSVREHHHGMGMSRPSKSRGRERRLLAAIEQLGSFRYRSMTARLCTNEAWLIGKSSLSNRKPTAPAIGLTNLFEVPHFAGQIRRGCVVHQCADCCCSACARSW